MPAWKTIPIEVPASHLSMISHPDAVTGLISSAALGTR